ncbi:hypothetical protein EA758_18160 [Acinetobacter pittii]|uniref:Uncharacterized protein n=2 Tax=Acinetobacter calcoaceticus/baumannii complex TaxID=909768 RepID=A0AB37TC85_ACIPI|nr:hypothetical protein J596_0218 [Acinetobacter baumannii 21072]KQE13602.1 hypothetical protein APD36_10385 [Acinetobacter pittii]RSO50148.1 hypothetical protein EA758_18160 [Acinetobacter pittii]RSO56138.1 hypothetical protein EA752_17165 [Acinetobacter pittii]
MSKKLFWVFISLLIIVILGLYLTGAYSPSNANKNCQPTNEYQYFYRAKAPAVKYTKYICISEEWISQQ